MNPNHLKFAGLVCIVSCGIVVTRDKLAERKAFIAAKRMTREAVMSDVKRAKDVTNNLLTRKDQKDYTYLQHEYWSIIKHLHD